MTVFLYLLGCVIWFAGVMIWLIGLLMILQLDGMALVGLVIYIHHT